MTHWDRKRRAWLPGPSRTVLAIVLGFALAAMAAVTQIDLTTQVKGILPTANGGTGIAFFTAAGPTVARTYTFPDANATIEYQANKNAANGYAGLTAGSKLTTSQGQEVWAVTDLTTYASVSGTGTTAIASTITTPSSGQCLKWDGANWVNQTCGSANFADNETPSGVIDGSNATFTLANSPNPALSLMLFKNGQEMIAVGADFTLTGNSIVFVTAAIPKTGDTLRASYRF